MELGSKEGRKQNQPFPLGWGQKHLSPLWLEPELGSRLNLSKVNVGF